MLVCLDFLVEQPAQKLAVLNLTFFAGITPGKHAFLARNHLLAEKQVPPKKLPLPGVIPGPESQIQHRLARNFLDKKMPEIFTEVGG